MITWSFWINGELATGVIVKLAVRNHCRKMIVEGSLVVLRIPTQSLTKFHWDTEGLNRVSAIVIKRVNLTTEEQKISIKIVIYHLQILPRDGSTSLGSFVQLFSANKFQNVSNSWTIEVTDKISTYWKSSKFLKFSVVYFQRPKNSLYK